MGGLVNDACGVCDGDGSSCAGCDGVPNSGVVDDACGVCGGDGSSCAGCDGVSNSGLVNDECGVCDGDGLSCKSRVTLEADTRLQGISLSDWISNSYSDSVKAAVAYVAGESVTSDDVRITEVVEVSTKSWLRKQDTDTATELEIRSVVEKEVFSDESAAFAEQLEAAVEDDDLYNDLLINLLSAAGADMDDVTVLSFHTEVSVAELSPSSPEAEDDNEEEEDANGGNSSGNGSNVGVALGATAAGLCAVAALAYTHNRKKKLAIYGNEDSRMRNSWKASWKSTDSGSFKALNAQALWGTQPTNNLDGDNEL